MFIVILFPVTLEGRNKERHILIYHEKGPSKFVEYRVRKNMDLSPLS